MTMLVDANSSSNDISSFGRRGRKYFSAQLKDLRIKNLPLYGATIFHLSASKKAGLIDSINGNTLDGRKSESIQHELNLVGQPSPA